MVTKTTVRILVVDDEADIRALLSALLGKAGYEVEAVASGAEALERLCEAGYDLMITDLVMPVMTGIDLLKEIRKRMRVFSMPRILVLSAEPGRLKNVEPHELPAYRVARKPFEHTKLLSVVGELLERA